MNRIITSETTGYQPVRAARGTAISCKGWQQEAALRVVMNGLDPEVAEKPGKSIACAGGGRGEAVRDWTSLAAIVAALQSLENDETLLVQPGEAAGIFRTYADAPRVLIAGGTWMYVGAQMALQESYEIFAAAGRKHFQSDLAGKLIASGGMGGRGGAQALAATLHGAAFLGIDVDGEHIKRRVKSGYCDVMVNDLDEALRILKNAVRKREATSVGLRGNCADVMPTLARRGIVPDVLTDQTGAHDPMSGYVPQGLDVAQANELRQSDPESYRKRALESIAKHVEGMLALQKLGSFAFEYGSNLRRMAFDHGMKNAFDLPGFAAEHGDVADGDGDTFQFMALSGEPGDIHRLDALLLEMFPGNERLARWIKLAQKRVRFQGLPARVCRLDYDEQSRFALAVNGLVAQGELKAPIAIEREQPVDSSAAGGSENKKMPDGTLDGTSDVGTSDGIEGTDGPAVLDALLGMANGASWISTGRHGEGRRMSRGIVADGTKEMAERIGRVLNSHAGSAKDGVMRKMEER
jgi:urocanate hydratase